jgi:antitoxin (DNA-binding transcriptional repressor) of toxin-antitoxin stability system
MCHDSFVPRINIRQLRDTRKLKAWLRAGKTVELRERGRLIARIIPQGSATTTALRPMMSSRDSCLGGCKESGVISTFRV